MIEARYMEHHQWQRHRKHNPQKRIHSIDAIVLKVDERLDRHLLWQIHEDDNAS
jgi:hypothetical protein